MSDKFGIKLRNGIVISKELEKFLNAYTTLTTQFFFDIDSRGVRTNEVNFLDVEDQKITYVDVQKYHGITSEEAYSPEFKPKRVQISPSRIFSKIFVESLVKRHISGNDLENFANLMKSYFGPPLTLKVVSGNDIKKYYSGRTYAKGNGTLNKSCMRYDENQNYFNLYIDNAKMLVGFDEDGKLAARAILWDNVGLLEDDKPTRFINLMDRIYTVHDKDVVQFKDWAKYNGYAYKQEQNHQQKDVICLDDKVIKARMFVNIPSLYEYEHFPYMDTFSYGFGELDILTNKIYTSDSVHLAQYYYHAPHNSFHETHGGYLQYFDDWHPMRPNTPHMYKPRHGFNADYNEYLKWLNSTFGTNFEEVNYKEKNEKIKLEKIAFNERLRGQIESNRQTLNENEPNDREGQIEPLNEVLSENDEINDIQESLRQRYGVAAVTNRIFDYYPEVDGMRPISDVVPYTQVLADEYMPIGPIYEEIPDGRPHQSAIDELIYSWENRG